MTTPLATSAHGAIISMGAGTSPQGWVAIGLVIQGPNTTESYRSIEAYPHDASALAVKPTIGDPGQATFSVLWDSADTTGHLALQTAFRAGTIKGWKITRTDTGAEIETFNGFVSELAKTSAPEGWNQADFTIKKTTAVVST